MLTELDETTDRNAVNALLISVMTFISVTFSVVSFGFSGEIRPSPISQHITQPFLTSMYRDSAGFLWVGTQHGLYQFDGAEVRKFDSSRQGRYYIPNSDIRGITEDHRNQLIIGTYGGGTLRLSEYSSRFEVFPKDSTPEMAYVTRISRIARDFLLVESRSGTSIVDFSTDKTAQEKEITPVFTALKNTVDSLFISNSEYLVATKKQIFRLIEDNSELISIEALLGSSEISSIAHSPPFNLYIGTSDARLLSYNLRLNTSVEAKSFTSEKITEITDIAVVDDRIWVGTNGGILAFDMQLRSLVELDTSNSQLSHNFVNNLLETNGILLIATVSGIDQVNPTTMSFFNNRNSGIHNDVSAFAHSGEDAFWVGTYNGLYKLKSTLSQLEVNDSERLTLPEEKITALASDPQYLWVGLANKGLHRLDIEKMEIKHIATKSERALSITKVLRTDKNNLMVSTYGQGLLRLENDVLVEIPNNNDEHSFILLHETRDRVIFSASETEVYSYNSASNVFELRKFLYPAAIKTNPLLLSINDDRDGNILFGTKDHGILKWKEADQKSGIYRLFQVGNESQVYRETIYSILIDRMSRLWCSTANGVIVLSPVGDLLFRLSSLDGLQSDDFNFGAYHVGPDGDFYFGGVDGYNRIDPSNTRITAKPAPIVITEASHGQGDILSYSELQRLDALVMPFDSKYLNFSLGLLDFTNIQLNQYKYKLQGFDPEWIDNGTNNKATYTSLPAGDYTFMAKGANAAGVWNEEGVSLRVRVLPPWWLTQWAYAFYVLCALCIVWSVMRLYRAQLLRQEAERRADEMHALADTIRDELQESQELQDGLVHSAYRHNVETIALIKQLTAVTGKSAGDEHLPGHLAAMEVLQKSYYFQNAELTVNLHEYVDGLCNLLLPRAAVDPATITTINLATSSLIPVQIATPLAIILYELLDNAMQHGFPDASPANFIQVSAEIKPSTSQAPDVLTITVQDDGVGLSPGLTVQSARSHGFMVVNALTQRLNGNIDVELGKGTTISVSLPLIEETA